MFGFGKGSPGQALLAPVFVLLIAAGLDKFQELLIAYQVLAGLELGDVGLVLAVLIVPAVKGIVVGLTDVYFASGNGEQLVFRCLAGFPDGRPFRLRLNAFQRVLADEHRGRLKVNSLMFDAHHDGPPVTVPVNRQRQRHGFDQLQHGLAHLCPVVQYFLDSGPVVVIVVQVVPAHFIHTHREDGFHVGVDAFFQDLGQYQFVHKEGGGVAKVENERMPERDRFLVIAGVISQAIEQARVGVEGVCEIARDFLALGVRGSLGQIGRAG